MSAQATPLTSPWPRRFALATAAVALLCLPEIPHLRYLLTHRATLAYSRPEELSSVFSSFFPDRYLLVPLLIAGFLPELWDRGGRG